MRTLKSILSFLAVVVVGVVLALGIRAFVAEVYEVPTGSMLETVQIGDRLIGEKISYRFRDPEPGEIVTFEDPEGSGQTLLKRVIATEGQTVELIDGVVYVDGVALDEPYVDGKPSDPIPFDGEGGGISYPYVVPEGCIWVMGDNRTNSRDSRYFGAIPVDSVTSRAVAIFWPFEDARIL